MYIHIHRYMFIFTYKLIFIKVNTLRTNQKMKGITHRRWENKEAQTGNRMTF